VNAAKSVALLPDRRPSPPLSRKSVSIGGLPIFSAADIEGTPCTGSSHGTIFHIAYAFEAHDDESLGKQLSALVQSTLSAYEIGCGGDRKCHESIFVHVFFDSRTNPKTISSLERKLSPIALRGLKVALHDLDFESIVTSKRKVWGYGSVESSKMDEHLKVRTRMGTISEQH